MEKRHKKLLDDSLYELSYVIWTEEEICYCITKLIELYQESTKKEEKEIKNV